MLAIRNHRFVLAAMLTLLIGACAKSPTGRRQLHLFPDSEMSAMGAAAFTEMKSQTPLCKDPQVNNYVRCVADAVTRALKLSEGPRSWEVVVFEDPQANAFALPGGKIGVYTGLLKVATTQDQLATVIGHEVAHVLAEHGNERMSTSFATEAGLQAAQIFAGSSENTQRALAVLGVGAQVGVLLPFSRAQESEADVLGLDLMARAGFDPAQSVSLWQNMARLSAGQPPEFLSTHPSHGSRIKDLSARVPGAQRIRGDAQRRGANPHCR